jgi:hypothetical protein
MLLLRISQLLVSLLTVTLAAPGKPWSRLESKDTTWPYGNDSKRLLHDATTSVTLAPTSTPPSTLHSSPSTSAKHRSTSPPISSWAFLFPLLSVSGMIWAIRKHGLRCCSDESILGDTIPSEIVLERKRKPEDWKTPEDIELQHVVIKNKAENQTKNDPVSGLSMLNCSDWTEDDVSKDNSFSWVEDGPIASYLYMED